MTSTVGESVYSLDNLFVCLGSFSVWVWVWVWFCWICCVVWFWFGLGSRTLFVAKASIKLIANPPASQSPFGVSGMNYNRFIVNLLLLLSGTVLNTKKITENKTV